MSYVQSRVSDIHRGMPPKFHALEIIMDDLTVLFSSCATSLWSVPALTLTMGTDSPNTREVDNLDTKLCYLLVDLISADSSSQLIVAGISRRHFIKI